jgi:hypothetical protein
MRLSPLLTALILACAAPAAAYTICDTEQDGSGEALHWPQEDPHEVFVTAVQGSEDMLPLVLEDTFRDSMHVWAQLEGSTMRFSDAGFVGVGNQGYDQENHLYFIERNWPHGNEIIALTTTQFWEDGEITDADTEYNGRNYDWSSPWSDDVRTDLMSIAVHEMGHSVGLCHSDVIQSTMFANYLDGETHQRDLAPDDVEGMESLYPCQEAEGCATVVEVLYGSGCALAGPPRGGPLALGMLLLLAAVAGGRRSHRSAGRTFPQSAKKRNSKAWIPKTFLAASALTAGAVSTPGSAAAADISFATLEELAAASPVVARVTVERAQSYVDSRSGNVRTRAVLVVEGCYRGALAEGAQLLVDEVGGIVDGRGTQVAGGVRLRTGEHLLVFLDAAAPSGLAATGAPDLGVQGPLRRVVGLAAGRWTVRWEAGAKLRLEPSKLAVHKLGIERPLPTTVSEFVERMHRARLLDRGTSAP